MVYNMTSHSKNSLLSVQNLQVLFKKEEEISKVVDNISFDIKEGETVCIVGESGCGKTVTALSILGLLPSNSNKLIQGKIIYKNNDLLSRSELDLQNIRGQHIGMVFQDPLTSLNPVFTIGEQIGEAIQAHNKIGAKELKQRCIQLLKKVGIPSPERQLYSYPHQLSGGQRQRVMIAIALSCNPDLVIADEPTTALDVTIQAQILNLFKSIQQIDSRSILYITHDLSVVAHVADRIYVMYAGIIVEYGNVDQIFLNPRHPYTKGLLSSLPTLGKKGGKLSSIPGSVPDPAHKPFGCPFHPRCYLAKKDCLVDCPDMINWGQGHYSRCKVELI